MYIHASCPYWLDSDPPTYPEPVHAQSRKGDGPNSSVCMCVHVHVCVYVRRRSSTRVLVTATHWSSQLSHPMRVMWSVGQTTAGCMCGTRCCSAHLTVCSSHHHWHTNKQVGQGRVNTFFPQQDAQAISCHCHCHCHCLCSPFASVLCGGRQCALCAHVCMCVCVYRCYSSSSFCAPHSTTQST